jgi:hypothetical protein
MTPLGRHQPGWDFASFSPVAGSDLAKSDLAKADTCRSQKAKAFPGVRRCSRATNNTESTVDYLVLTKSII